MKKFFSLIVLSGLFLCLNPHLVLGGLGLMIGQTTQNQDNPLESKHRKKEADKASKELQIKEQKKKQIESEEHSINKNKRVKRFSSDKEIPETVKKRNIP